MATMRCPGCGREISDKALYCPYCETEIVSSIKSKSESPIQNTTQSNAQKQKIDIKPLIKIFGILALVLLVIGVFRWSMPTKANDDDDDIVGTGKYYIVQVMDTPIQNGIGVADKYIHSSKSCCQKVVDAYNNRSNLTARIHRVNLKTIAYENSIGQSVPVEAALRYCPLCFEYKG